MPDKKSAKDMSPQEVARRLREKLGNDNRRAGFSAEDRAYDEAEPTARSGFSAEDVVRAPRQASGRLLARPSVDIQAELARTRAKLDEVRGQKVNALSDAQAASLQAKGNALQGAQKAMLESPSAVGGAGAPPPSPPMAPTSRGMSDPELERQGAALAASQRAMYTAPPAVKVAPTLDEQGDDLAAQQRAMYGAPSPLRGRY